MTTTHRGAPRATRSTAKLDTARKLAMQRVREAFRPQILADMCVRQDFSDYATRYDLEGKDRFFYYRDNGAKVLAVAHLDSCQDDGTCSIVNTNAGPLAVSGALDDRLGAYVILDLLPRLGINVDILLTTDEEKCATTADEFDTLKSYDWMISFDRGGTDVVLYQYETPELCGLVEDSGARVGEGSYSDICALEHLGVAGLNWGVGYQDYHGPRSHAWLEDTFRMVARYMKFHEANAGTALVHTSTLADDDDPWADDDDAMAARWDYDDPRWDDPDTDPDELDDQAYYAWVAMRGAAG